MIPESLLHSEADALLHQAASELRQHLETGQDFHAETVLSNFPSLASDPHRAVELIVLEFQYRRQLGQNPRPDGWYQRFPHSCENRPQAALESAVRKKPNTHIGKSISIDGDCFPSSMRNQVLLGSWRYNMSSTRTLSQAFRAYRRRAFSLLELLSIVVMTAFSVGMLLPAESFEPIPVLAMGCLTINIDDICPVTNPLHVTGTVSGCFNPTITVWLTDDNGDQIPGGVSWNRAGGKIEWDATFLEEEGGEYTLNVKVECNCQVQTKCIPITLPDPYK